MRRLALITRCAHASHDASKHYASVHRPQASTHARLHGLNTTATIHKGSCAYSFTSSEHAHAYWYICRR